MNRPGSTMLAVERRSGRAGRNARRLPEVVRAPATGNEDFAAFSRVADIWPRASPRFPVAQNPSTLNSFDVTLTVGVPGDRGGERVPPAAPVEDQVGEGGDAGRVRHEWWNR